MKRTIKDTVYTYIYKTVGIHDLLIDDTGGIHIATIDEVGQLGNVVVGTTPKEGIIRHYYWKLLHMPSGEYVINSISGTTLHTNRIGSHWDNSDTLLRMLNRRKNPFKTVKGPLTIKFDKRDFELQQFRIKLHHTIRL